MYRLKFKQVNMLCPMCVLNVAKALSQIKDIHNLNVDLESKTIILTHNNKDLSRQAILDIINESINNGRAREGLFQK